MAATDAMNIKRPVRCILCHVDESCNLLAGRLARVAHPYVDILHARRFGIRLFVIGRVIAQVNDSLNAERGERLVIIWVGLRASIKVLVHLPEVLDRDMRKSRWRGDFWRAT